MSANELPPQDPGDTTEGSAANATLRPDPRAQNAASSINTDAARTSIFRIGLRTFVENKLALVGACTLLAIIVFCFVGPLVYHTNQVATNLLDANLRPGEQGHLLGTNPDGYDVLGRLMVGGQVSLELGIASALVATVVGTLWGATAGYLGGWVDAIMMRVVDAALSIPVLFLLIVLATIITPTKVSMILIISLASWLSVSRLVRGEALSLRTREYVQAVKVMGGGGFRIVLRHITPNAIGTIIVNATFQVADAILFIAAISFLGLGLAPPQTDLGGILANGTNYVDAGYWWLIYPAGILIVLIVIAVNFIGDALRDAFEVRLRQR
jgi:peptide/nickel transport system permease protein